MSGGISRFKGQTQMWWVPLMVRGDHFHPRISYIMSICRAVKSCLLNTFIVPKLPCYSEQTLASSLGYVAIAAGC